jgi:plastocyanin
MPMYVKPRQGKQAPAPHCRQAATGVLLCLVLAAPIHAAERIGAVSGTVRFDPSVRIAHPARYRMRTRTPILDPDPPRAIAYLESADGRYPDPATAQVAEISQRGYQFRPGMLAVRTGTRVGFPNHDDEFHSVFSYSSVKRFDLGRFRKDESSPQVPFDQPGLVKVYCEIHKHMRGFVLVLETTWFTATDIDGNFVIDKVPAGDYRLRVFLPSEVTHEVAVTVRAGEITRAEFGP